MKIIADTHTHTLASGHAYSTITENLRYAAAVGLQFLCCTDHTAQMPDAPYYFYFSNLSALPDEMFGVYLLRGCEVNVVSDDGALDLDERQLEKLEWVIASLHEPCLAPGTRESNTRAWLNVAKNPLVDVIGHAGDSRFMFDYEPVIKAFREYAKIVEINSHSFCTRPGSPQNCREIALLCKKYEVPVVVSSDAHFYRGIGDFSDATEMLEEIAFPEKLVLNADYCRFADFLERLCGRKFPALPSYQKEKGDLPL